MSHWAPNDPHNTQTLTKRHRDDVSWILPAPRGPPQRPRRALNPGQNADMPHSRPYLPRRGHSLGWGWSHRPPATHLTHPLDSTFLPRFLHTLTLPLTLSRHGGDSIGAGRTLLRVHREVALFLALHEGRLTLHKPLFTLLAAYAVVPYLSNASTLLAILCTARLTV